MMTLSPNIHLVPICGKCDGRVEFYCPTCQQLEEEMRRRCTDDTPPPMPLEEKAQELKTLLEETLNTEVTLDVSSDEDGALVTTAKLQLFGGEVSASHYGGDVLEALTRLRNTVLVNMTFTAEALSTIPAEALNTLPPSLSKEAVVGILNGMQEITAETFLEKASIQYRITSRDGTSFIGTLDYKPNRANLGITGGHVSSVRWGLRPVVHGQTCSRHRREDSKALALL